ncbi:hypothetical protein [Polaromonas naphthalenivorans]|uniref:Uncharacterized protein n=1 Tax=Polaromonas naphthalenivorans (strain CJ2) TaxID=365044 RepID=A1VQJ3_POLNA|nr:hypothetical protein [Polaromonas naphthalenivorans]ABM37921.1 hypothetical protein Pnap_2619 [Polaromonas naphthalenivorans CJ2]
MNTQKIPHLPGLISLAALLVALLPACAPLPPAPGTGQGPPTLRPVGRITSIEGPNAFVDRGNHGAGQPAQLGQALLAGDRFYTGPGTRMKIDFWNGGYLEMDENTDPSLFQDLGCLVVSLFRSGRIFVDKSDACVESLGTKSQQFSKVAYAVMPAGAGPYLQITVVEGEARTLLPAVATAPGGWRIDVNSRGLLGDGRAYRVPDEAIRQSIGWTLYYRNRSRVTPAPEFPIFRLPFPPPVRQPQYPAPGRDTPVPGRLR